MADACDVDRESTAILPAPFGCISIQATARAITTVDLASDSYEALIPATPLMQEAARQFAAYFADPGFCFDLPLALSGTLYQLKVWQALQEIPAGTVQSYGRLARELGSGPRAIAGACRSNDFPILIPCHRVVAQQGLGGYCGRREGQMLEIKRWLLRHERHEHG